MFDRTKVAVKTLATVCIRCTKTNLPLTPLEELETILEIEERLTHITDIKKMVVSNVLESKFHDHFLQRLKNNPLLQQEMFGKNWTAHVAVLEFID